MHLKWCQGLGKPFRNSGLLLLLILFLLLSLIIHDTRIKGLDLGLGNANPSLNSRTLLLFHLEQINLSKFLFPYL